MTITDAVIDGEAIATWYCVGATVVGSAFAGGCERNGGSTSQRAISVVVAAVLWPTTLVRMFVRR